jgi:hypothetical protein
MRRRIMRWFKQARLLETAEAADVLAWENSGVSVDASRMGRSTALPQARDR